MDMQKSTSLSRCFLLAEMVGFSRGLSNSNGLRLLIFPQPLGRALKNQNAAPTTPPCFGRRPRSSLLLFEPCTATNKKSPDRMTASFLVDIPGRWPSRAKQSRTVALLTALCAAALFESCTVLL